MPVKTIVVNLDKCMGCRSCEIACALWRDSPTQVLIKATREVPKPVTRVRVRGDGDGAPIPIRCTQCEDAPCAYACPSQALQQLPGGGVTLDTSRCVGCFMCTVVCPFGAVIPLADRLSVLKCDGCLDMEEAACMRACPTGAIQYIDERVCERSVVERGTRNVICEASQRNRIQ